MKSKTIRLSLEDLKNIVSSFEMFEDLNEEKNTYLNGCVLEVFRN